MKKKSKIIIERIEVLTNAPSRFRELSFTGDNDMSILNKGFTYSHYDQYGGYWVYTKKNPDYEFDRLSIQISKDISVKKKKKYNIDFDTYSATLIYPIPEDLRDDILDAVKKNSQYISEGEAYDKICDYFTGKKLFEDSISIYHKKYPAVLAEALNDELIDLTSLVLEISEKSIKFVNGEWDIVRIYLNGKERNIDVNCEVVDTSQFSITGCGVRLSYKNRYFKRDYKSEEKYNKRFHKLNACMHDLWSKSLVNMRSEWNYLKFEQFRDGELRLTYEWSSMSDKDSESKIHSATKTVIYNNPNITPRKEITFDWTNIRVKNTKKSKKKNKGKKS